MKTKKRNWVILVMVILALGLRIYNLDLAPHGFNADEAAIGYNAYSLLKTGRDEHGHSWPLHFQSFNDFKPGGYVYLVLPFVWLLGLTEIAVRLPSLVAGVIAVYGIYLFAREIFLPKDNPWFGWLAALSLALSPWHIQFSRGAWETNVATTLLIFGFWLYFRGMRTNNFRFLLGALVLLVSSTYVYHSSRITAPLLLLGLMVVYRQKWLRFGWRKIGLFLVVGLVLSAPIVGSLLAGDAASRFAGVGIIGDIGPTWNANRLRGEHKSQMGAWWVALLHNRPVTYLIKIKQNWFQHFEAEFLFIEGDRIRRSHCPGIGQLYYLDLFLLLTAAYFAFRNQEKSLLFPFAWLLVAPLPAALTIQSPHALRSHAMIVPLALFIGYGAGQLFHAWKKRRVGLVIGGLLFVSIVGWQTGYFFNQYLRHYPAREPQVWEFGFRELVPYLESVKDRYEKIYVTDRYDQPYILFLFYLRYPPEKFQQEGVLTPRDKFGFSTVRSFDKYYFKGIDWEGLEGQKQTLVAGTNEEIPDEVDLIKQIYFSNGEPVFQIAER